MSQEIDLPPDHPNGPAKVVETTDTHRILRIIECVEVFKRGCKHAPVGTEPTECRDCSTRLISDVTKAIVDPQVVVSGVIGRYTGKMGVLRDHIQEAIIGSNHEGSMHTANYIMEILKRETGAK